MSRCTPDGSGSARDSGLATAGLFAPIVSGKLLRSAADWIKGLFRGPGEQVADVLTGGAHFVVDADGTVRIFVDDGALEVSEHAARRITERGLTVGTLDDVVSTQKPFDYFHDGVWKVGFYDAAQGGFVGSVGDTITTVITDVTPSYINNLKAATP